jgi:hypothetical protein
VPICVRRAEFAHDDAVFDRHPFEMPPPTSAPPAGAPATDPLPFAIPPDSVSMSALDRLGERLDEIEAKYGPNADPEKVLNELLPDADVRQKVAQITLLKNRLMKKHGHKLNPKPTTN